MNGTRRTWMVGIGVVTLGLCLGLAAGRPRGFENPIRQIVALPAQAVIRLLLAPVRIMPSVWQSPWRLHIGARPLSTLASRTGLNRDALYDLAPSGAGQSAQAPAPRVQPARPAPALPPGWTESTRYIYSRPVFRVGQDYTVHADDHVREVVSISGNVTVEGRVENDIVVVLGDVKLASTADVRGSVVVTAGNVVIAQGAAIHDDMIVVGGAVDAPPGFSPDGQHVAIGATPLGDSLRNLVPWFTGGLLWGRLIVPDLHWVWGVVAVFFLISAAFNLIFDKPVRRCSKVVHDRPIAAMVAGMLVLILLGPIFLIMAATVVGIAVIPFVGCGVIVAWMLGKVGVVRALGARVWPPGDPETRLEGMRSFVIGFAAIVLAYMVPVLGLVAWAMVGVFGLGSATLTFFAAIKREPKPRPAGPAPANAPPSPPAPSSGAPPGTVDPGWSPSYGESSGAAAAPGLAFSGPAEPPPAAAVPQARGVSATGVPYATFLDRVAAFVLDCLLLAIANGFMRFARADGPLILLALAYHIAFWAWMGTTMGGIIVGIKVMRTDGTPVRPVDALVRGLASIFSMAALGIGCLWMLQDAERQMWHDKIAGTYVVKVPRNLLLA